MHKNSDKSSNLPITSIKLILYSFAIQATVLIILCIIALISDINSGLFYPFAVVGLCLGNIVSGFVNGRTKKQNGLINGIVYTLPAAFILILISLYLNGFSIGYRLPVSAALLCVSAAIGGILSVNVKKKVKIKR